MVAGEYPPAVGGLADYTAMLSGKLETLGFSVTVATARRDASLCSGRTLNVPGWGLRWIGEVARRIAETRPDVVHLQYQAAAFEMSGAIALLPLALRRWGARPAFVTTFHDLRVPYLFPKAGPLRRAVLRVLMGMSDASIFVDPVDLVAARPRRAAAWIPIGNTIARSPNPNPTAERARLGIDPGAFVVAYFGFINASKGVDVLLAASERLVRSGLDLVLLFVGDEVGSSDPTNAATARRMRARATALGLDGRIVRTGALPAADIPRALAAADMAALPFLDGASMRHASLLACLAQGLPVVTTTPRPAPALLPRYLAPPFEDTASYRIDEHVAELIPPNDDAALARAIHRLANDPPRREALAREGRALADRLDWGSIAQATAEVYRRASARRR